MVEQIKNPFAGYESKLIANSKKINPIDEIVNMFYQMKKIDNMTKEFYKGKYSYGKLAKEAKMLLLACDGNLEDALWSLDRMKYKAIKGNYDWSISTCLKNKLTQ